MHRASYDKRRKLATSGENHEFLPSNYAVYCYSAIIIVGHPFVSRRPIYANCLLRQIIVDFLNCNHEKGYTKGY
jgi:hypothetical protein